MDSCCCTSGKGPRIVYPPARVNAGQAAEILGFAEHDIPVLVKCKLLKPLGKPVQSATKYFATCDIKNLGNDSAWLSRATQAAYDYWKDKNARKSCSLESEQRDNSLALLAA